MAPATSTWTGRAALEAAEQMAMNGGTGVVVDVRYPIYHPLRDLDRSWWSVRVDVGPESKAFYPAGDKRSPFCVPLEPGAYVVAAINEELERVEREVVVQSPGIQVIAVRPSYVWALFWRTAPRIDVVQSVRT